MLKIDFCLQSGEILIFYMLCVCFVFVFVEQIGPGSRARSKQNVCVSFAFVVVNRLDRPLTMKNEQNRILLLGVANPSVFFTIVN